MKTKIEIRISSLEQFCKLQACINNISNTRNLDSPSKIKLSLNSGRIKEMPRHLNPMAKINRRHTVNPREQFRPKTAQREKSHFNTSMQTNDRSIGK